jgi:hypothetical protein
VNDVIGEIVFPNLKTVLEQGGVSGLDEPRELLRFLAKPIE